MKIRPTSDWHTEMWAENFDKAKRIIDEHLLVPLSKDKDTILLLAGDIGTVRRSNMLYECIKHCSMRFKEVYYIAGNHEHYHGVFEETEEQLKELLAPLLNVYVANGIERSSIGDDFINSLNYCTLWTDYNSGNQAMMNTARQYMNDYRLIHSSQSLIALQPDAVLEHHRATRNRLSEITQEGDIIMTHHAPHFNSVNPKYHGDSLNPCYYSDLTELIREKKPKLWFHGHMHDACDYVIEGCRVICNPFGYGREQFTNGYNSKLVVEI